MYYNSIIETIGHTPLVKLNRLSEGIEGTILVKPEYFNPGNSVKDRVALKMIEDAERDGKLRPGGTIIEGTSGNTGMGLALTAIAKGYKCIFTLADKQSQEKIDILRAVGAEVIVCPTNVAPDDPRSYYSVAKKLTETIPNAFYPNQYDNPFEHPGSLRNHRTRDLGTNRREDYSFRCRSRHRRHHQRSVQIPERAERRRV